MGVDKFKHSDQYIKGSCHNEGMTRSHLSGEQSITYSVGGASECFDGVCYLVFNFLFVSDVLYCKCHFDCIVGVCLHLSRLVHRKAEVLTW